MEIQSKFTATSKKSIKKRPPSNHRTLSFLLHHTGWRVLWETLAILFLAPFVNRRRRPEPMYTKLYIHEWLNYLCCVTEWGSTNIGLTIKATTAQLTSGYLGQEIHSRQRHRTPKVQQTKWCSLENRDIQNQQYIWKTSESYFHTQARNMSF